MSEITLPTVGRVVHYYPNGADEYCAANGAVMVPATVVQSYGTLLNLAVTCMNDAGPVVLRYTIPHRAATAPGQAYHNSPYWDWLETM